MGIRFIGHKQALLPEIVRVIRGTVEVEEPWIADLFAGTGTVSAALKREGFRVIGNDLLAQSVVSLRALLYNSSPPPFDALLKTEPHIGEVPNGFIQQVPYTQVLSFLNQLDGEGGFFYQNYAPGGTRQRGHPRKYFTDENAKVIDSIRSTIRRWKVSGLLTPAEHALLLYDLIRAVNHVANTAGTYGAFLKGWYDRAREPLQLTPTELPSGPMEHQIFQMDANDLVRKITPDAAYLDPPYTKRQYAAYYHIPETIAEEDEPAITGKTGLRPWKSKSSDYCHKRRAAGTLRELIEHLETPHIFLSYSEDGHIPPGEAESILGRFGDLTVHEFEHPRYKSNGNGSSSPLTERLYVLDKR